MGHRINQWTQRLLAPCLVVATMVLLHLRYSVWRIVAIELPLFALLTLAMIFVDPGPKTRGLVEGLKSRFR